jgi:hypothetical protein
MQTETYIRGRYHVIRINEDLNATSDLSDVKVIVSGLLGQGVRDIAFTFTNDSWLCSNALTVLIMCSKLIQNKNGEMAVVGASKLMLDTLSLLSLNKNILTLYGSEEELIAG